MVVVRWEGEFGVPGERCGFGVAGGMYQGKGVGKLWGWSAADAACLPAPAAGSKHHFDVENKKQRWISPWTRIISIWV